MGGRKRLLSILLGLLLCVCGNGQEGKDECVCAVCVVGKGPWAWVGGWVGGWMG